MAQNVWQPAAGNPLISLIALLTSRQNTAYHCSVCQKRSTWDFLQEFYARVDAAHQFARKLEIDLQDARFGAQHFQRAFANCQSQLAACKAELEEERLSHGVTRKDLDLERENHKETERLFELAFSIAQQNDDLQGEVTESGRHTISDISNSSVDLQLQLQHAKQQVKHWEALISQTSQADLQTELGSSSMIMNSHSLNN